jgi:oxalate decarboxylase/phosphoglucose isomerase-like protein (cupin superfamily)
LEDACRVQRIQVHGDKPKVVDIPPYTIHSIRNTGSTEMVLMVGCSEDWDEKDPDTFPEIV